jgi:prolyl oligopeptidase
MRIHFLSSSLVRTSGLGVALLGGLISLVACAGSGGGAAANETGGAGVAVPASEKRQVSDSYHGVTVTEDYRWLENFDDATVKAWTESQNAHARSHLDRIGGREQVARRVGEILSAPTVSIGAPSFAGSGTGQKAFAFKRQPPKPQPVYVVFDTAAGAYSPNVAGATEPKYRVLLDPAVIDPSGKTTLDWVVPSPSGTRVAASLSKAGSEAGDLHIFDVATGQQVFETIARVHGGTAGGSLAWVDDNSFYYTRYPRQGERAAEDMDFYVQVYFHTLGTDPKQDRYEIGKDFPKIGEIMLEVMGRPAAAYSGDVTQPSGFPAGSLLVTVQNGDGGEFIHFLREVRTAVGEPAKTVYRQLTTYNDRVVQATFGDDGMLYMVSRKDAPRGKLLKLAGSVTERDPASGRLAIRQTVLSDAKVLVPEDADTLVSAFGEDASNIVVSGGRVYATYQLGGPSEIRVFSTSDGERRTGPKQLSVGTVAGLASPVPGVVTFSNVSFTRPAAVYAFNAGTGTTVQTRLGQSSIVSLDDYTVTREFATSKDGTKVPVNIIARKGVKLDGTNPTLVTGYGGYGVNIEPSFRGRDAVLLEKGFVIAIVNLRGGGEYGEAWHTGGNLLNKQNVFDDFAASCRFMIDRKYTSAEKLAIEGGSNGGLLMGAVMVQNPDLCRAVISHVGIYDMLRVELSSNGAFNITEFGSVKDPAQFKALYAYSPYHNVKDGVKYPALLLTTGANDPRVDPMQSRKFTARVQAATSGVPGARPVLLLTNYQAGHGMGTPLAAQIEQKVDVVSFLCEQLGVK